MKKIIKTVLSFIICTGLLVGGSYLYLSKDTAKTAKTKAEKDNVPYYDDSPENCGVLVRMAKTKAGVLFYLDFKEKKINVIPIEKCNEAKTNYNGFSADYDVYADNNFISGFIDRIGGINTEINGEKVRLTGIGVIEELKKPDNSLNKYKVFLSTIEAVKENGIDKEDIAYIMNSGIKNDLSLTKCIRWINYLPSMLNSISIVDYRK